MSTKQKVRTPSRGLTRSSVAFESLQQLLKTPLNFLLNVILIAVAVSLPVLLDLSVENIKRWAGYGDNGLEITLYIKSGVSEADARALEARVRSWPGVDEVRYVSSEAAMASLKSQNLIGNALEGITSNPLPASIIIALPHDSSVQALAEELISRAEKETRVDWVLFDMDWFRKASAIINTGERVIVVLTALLSLSVCLVIGNCVRLTINNKREEILVNKLVGATDAYVRKPFLLMGMWVGIMGSVAGLSLCIAGWWALRNNMGEMNIAYGGNISLIGVQPLSALTVIFSCAIFGLLGAWLICNRHLKDITPA